MNWLFPGFLAGAAAIALPILLHLLRRQPRRTIVFPSLRFLAAAQRQTERQHRLRRFIVLLLRCAALALLAAAFARPFLGSNAGGGGRAVVVVVDHSFSLQSKGRWEKLRTWAKKEIGPLREGDKLGIMLAGPRPVWLAPLNTDTAGALARFEQLAPGWDIARVEPALRSAAETLTATPVKERKLIFAGDHQRVSWSGADFSKALPDGVAVVFPSLPDPIARQAALLAPTLTRNDGGLHVALSIRNFSAAHKRTLRIFRDGGVLPVHEQTIDLGDRETRAVPVDLAGAPPALARFRFALDADDLPADDTAYAVWQSTGSDRTLLLDAAPGDSAADFAGTAFGSTSTLKPALRVVPVPAGVWPAKAVAVLRNDASFAGPSVARLEAFLRDGGSALIFVNGGEAQWKWLAATRRIAIRPLKAEKTMLHVHDWAMDHPIVATMTEHRVTPLLGWDFRQGWALPTGAVDSIALWTEDAAAIGEVQVGAGRLLLCGFPPDRRDGEWPVQAAFVPFLHRAVTYLLGAQETAAVLPAKVGDPLRLPTEPGKWVALDGPATTEPARELATSVTPTAPGLYEFAQGTERKLFAVNLNADESDLASWEEGTPWTALVSTAPPPKKTELPAVSLAALEAEQQNSLWWWAVAAIALILLAELGVANRTAR
ncbi:MAG TPA: BatA domain-containing protein [Opitutaceae bacterium]|nr:BatA domain-containing protein [Opitutaceae bacterium]